jgi:hypothetical protein
MRDVFVLGLCCLLSVASCSSPPLPHAHASPEALARAVLDAVAQRDVEALRMLALNKEEFEEHVWPELPAARPERNLTANYVWGDLQQKSNIMLRAMLAAHGGKRYELTGIRFLGETTAYASFRVHRESELSVKQDGGDEQQIRLFGSMIEKAGKYKVFSYVNQD